MWTSVTVSQCYVGKSGAAVAMGTVKQLENCLASIQVAGYRRRRRRRESDVLLSRPILRPTRLPSNSTINI